jgi:predicted MFS family arabinose efflux permease
MSNIAAAASQRPGMDRKTWAVGMVGFCAFLSLYATQPLLPLLQKAFSTSKLGASLTVSAATIAVALAAPWVGMVADVHGRKRVIVPAVFILGLANLLTACSMGLPSMLAWRFVQGLATPAVFAVTVAYINEEWPAGSAAFATSVYVTGTVLGGFTGRFLSGLIAERLGWRWSFAALGLLNLGMGWMVAAWMPLAQRFKRQQGYGRSARALFKHLTDPGMLGVFGVGFCILFALVGTFTYVTFHLAAPPYSLSTSQLGSIFFVYLVGAVITPLAGHWAGQLPSRMTLSLSLLCSCLGVLLTLAQPLWAVVAGIALCSSGVFICQTITNRLVGQAAKGSAAAAVGWYVSFYYLGGFVGSVAPGLLWAWGGWPGCVALIASVLALAALYVSLSPRFRGR